MRAALALLLVGVLATGCADDRESYCQAVEERQAELSEQVAGGGPADLIGGLELLQALADEAPEDIQDEWAIVIARVTALHAALDEAGVDPATYDAQRPPADLGSTDRDRIERAARDLGSEETQRALADLEQQALDVCGTPLVV
jgi:hypothetical protein